MLEPVVKPWILDIRAGRIDLLFILEEDGDSGHRGGKANNPVRRWKQEMWDGVSQPFINERIHTMPDGLRAVVAGEGAMTGY